MKKIIKNRIIATLFIFGVLIIPNITNADTDIYGGYDYDTSYGGYDYDTSYGGYDYDTSYGGYDYDTSYGGYDYDTSYGGYDYDTSYGGYDYDYSYGGYDYDTSYGGYDYDYSYGGYDYDNNYEYTDDYYYPQDDYYAYNDDYGYNDDYYGYDDYGYDDYYGYDDNYGCSSNCGGTYNPPVYDDLDVICTVSDRTIEEGDSVTFTATADGGRGSYTYRWTGDVLGTTRSVTQRFNREGTYYGTVRVTDRDGRTATANCASVRVEGEEDQVEDEDFDVVCKVSDTSIEEGDSVRFTAEVDGGDSPYEYDWSGDVNEDEKTFTKRFSREGRYEVEVRVTDDEGRTARDTCSVIRVDQEDDNDRDRDDDRDINISSGTLSSGSGTLSGVSSVYLNQIPYTGPEDVAKVIAFIVAILAWSIAGAMIIKNRMNKKSISNRVAAFKESNKLQN